MTLTSGERWNLGFGHFPGHLAYEVKIRFRYCQKNSTTYVRHLSASLSVEANNVEMLSSKALIALITNGD